MISSSTVGRIFLGATLALVAGCGLTASAQAQLLSSSIQGKRFGIQDGGGSFRFPFDFPGVPAVPFTNPGTEALTITSTKWSFTDPFYSFFDSGIDSEILQLNFGTPAQTLTLAPGQTISYPSGYTGNATYLLRFGRVWDRGNIETGTDVTVTLFGYAGNNTTANDTLGTFTFQILPQSQFITIPEAGTLPLLALSGGLFAATCVVRRRLPSRR